MSQSKCPGLASHHLGGSEEDRAMERAMRERAQTGFWACRSLNRVLGLSFANKYRSRTRDLLLWRSRGPSLVG
jgi:hypothetical protein